MKNFEKHKFTSLRIWEIGGKKIFKKNVKLLEKKNKKKKNKFSITFASTYCLKNYNATFSDFFFFRLAKSIATYTHNY